MIRRLHRHAARARRGQAMVEMAMILPLLLLLVLGMLEFGIAFDHNLTLEYATREGARTGSALANGGGALGCGNSPPQSPNRARVDPAIIEAVQRVLTSTGSPIDVSEISQIRIYKANASGDELPQVPAGPAKVNRWVYVGPGLGDLSVQGLIDGTSRLDFRADTAQQTWPTCTRVNGVTPDSVGVSLVYRYSFQTPLGALLSLVEIHMHDHTVMSLNPTNK